MFFSKTQTTPIKTWQVVFFFAMIAVAIGFKVYAAWWPKARVMVGGQDLRVLVADTQAHRIEGWSNKDSMGNYDGMLFVFPQQGNYIMVMRQMRFPLDIVWINGDTIVDIAPNLQPDPSPTEASLVKYSARLPSTLVLELPAGFTERHDVKVGDKVSIRKD